MSVPWVKLPKGVAFLCGPEGKYGYNFLLPDGTILHLLTNKEMPMTDVQILEASIQSKENYYREVRENKA